METFRLGIIGLETLSNDPCPPGAPAPGLPPHAQDLTELRQVFQPTEQLEVTMCSPHPFLPQQGIVTSGGQPQDEAIATRDQELSCSTEKPVGFRYPVLECVILAGPWMQAVEC